LRERIRRGLRELLAQPNTHDDWYWVGHRGLKASIAVALLTLGDDAGAAYLHALADKNDDVFYAWLAPAILQLPDSKAAAGIKKRLTAEAILKPPPGSTRRSEPGLQVMKAQALGLLPGAESTAALLELTRFHSRYVRAEAAKSLLRIAPAKRGVVQKLHQKDRTDFVRSQTARALGLAGPLSRLAATAEDPLDRATALEGLAELHPPTAAGIIQKQVGHPHPYVRQSALESLEKVDAKRARPVAKKLVKDADPRVRLTAHKVLLSE
jgi:HEAT repeat protein